MSENGNGNGAFVGAFVRSAKVQMSCDDETLVAINLPGMMRFQSHFEGKLGFRLGEKSGLRRHAQDHHDMSQGGE